MLNLEFEYPVQLTSAGPSMLKFVAQPHLGRALFHNLVPAVDTSTPGPRA